MKKEALLAVMAIFNNDIQQQLQRLAKSCHYRIWK